MTTASSGQARSKVAVSFQTGLLELSMVLDLWCCLSWGGPPAMEMMQ